MKNINLNVTFDNIEMDDSTILTGNVNVYNLICNFPKEFENLVVEIWVENINNIILSKTMYTPNMPIKLPLFKNTGRYKLSVYAYKILNSKKIIQYAPTACNFFVEKGAWNDTIPTEEEVNKTEIIAQEIKNIKENIDKKHSEVVNAKIDIAEINKIKEDANKINKEIENKKNTVLNTEIEINKMSEEVKEKTNNINTTYKNFQQDLGNRVATLESGKIPVNQIPRIAITETKTFKTTAERDQWINSEEGDIAIISDENKTYIKNSENNWVLLESPSDYSTNSGHATTADNASNSSKINGKSIVYMTKDEYDSAYNSDILLEDTYYFVV